MKYIHGGIMSISINMDVPFSYGIKSSLLQNEPEQVEQRSRQSIKNDTVEFNPVLKNLALLDFSNSSISGEGQFSNFNFLFKSVKNEKLSLDGYYSEKENIFNFSLKYRFIKEVNDSGVKSMKTFEATLDFNSSYKDILSINKGEQKEDILSFVGRIINTIIKSAGDDKKVISGIIFKDEDLKEITEIGDKKILSEIFNLIQTIYSNQKIKEQLQNSKKKEEVILKPEREKSETIDITKESKKNNSVSLSIKEVEEQSPTENQNERKV